MDANVRLTTQSCTCLTGGRMMPVYFPICSPLASLYTLYEHVKCIEACMQTRSWKSSMMGIVDLVSPLA